MRKHDHKKRLCCTSLCVRFLTCASLYSNPSSAIAEIGFTDAYLRLYTFKQHFYATSYSCFSKTTRLRF